jgi:hypothetical protein
VSDTDVRIRNQASAMIRRLAAQLSPEGRRKMMQYCAGRALRRLKRHFRTRETSGDSKRARRGWPSRHFWAQIERSTQVLDVTERGAKLVVSDPRFPQKVYGGEIVPKRGRYLALPLRAEAYAAGSPREWNQRDRLRVIRSRRGNLFLAEPLAGGGIRVQYLLRKKVNQRPDPQALPRPGVIDTEVIEAAREYTNRRVLPRQGGQS